jgi:release factor glutamine methyltransferase
MFDQLQKIYANRFLKPYLTWYLKKERTTNVRGFKLQVMPTVFHPKYFFSTSYLFDFVSKLNLNNKKFLEIGSGSGIISLLAYQKKAMVICCDINEVAVECTKLNFENNFNSARDNFTCLKSDVFGSIQPDKFDIIVINPPYFFNTISNKNQLAWNCGNSGEFFIKLFSQLINFSDAATITYMVLADNCEIDRIMEIANSHQFLFELVEQKKITWEVNFIFKITAI